MTELITFCQLHNVMQTLHFVTLLTFILGINAHPDPVRGYDIEEPLLYDTFPDDFMWGTATAAYQVSKFT